MVQKRKRGMAKRRKRQRNNPALPKTKDYVLSIEKVTCETCRGKGYHPVSLEICIVCYGTGEQ